MVLDLVVHVVVVVVVVLDLVLVARFVVRRASLVRHLDLRNTQGLTPYIAIRYLVLRLALSSQTQCPLSSSGVGGRAAASNAAAAGKAGKASGPIAGPIICPTISDLVSSLVSDLVSSLVITLVSNFVSSLVGTLISTRFVEVVVVVGTVADSNVTGVTASSSPICERARERPQHEGGERLVRWQGVTPGDSTYLYQMLLFIRAHCRKFQVINVGTKL